LVVRRREQTNGRPDSIRGATQAGWRESTKGKVIEIGWLARNSPRAARYQAPKISELGL